MTVGRLLEDMTSMELTMWQHFLKADAERTQERIKREREDREILGADI